MNNAYLSTAIVIRDLKCYSIDTIGKRILLQKKVYLAQDLGLPLGYGYSWYIHGPYSTDLTAVVYQIIPEGTEAIEGKTLKPQYRKIVESVNGLEGNIEEYGLRLTVVQWYELIASIAYWYSRGYTTEDRVEERIRVTKPQFTEEQTKNAFESYIKLKQPQEEFTQ